MKSRLVLSAVLSLSLAQEQAAEPGVFRFKLQKTSDADFVHTKMLLSGSEAAADALEHVQSAADPQRPAPGGEPFLLHLHVLVTLMLWAIKWL